jgi:hypothetical protein
VLSMTVDVRRQCRDGWYRLEGGSDQWASLDGKNAHWSLAAAVVVTTRLSSKPMGFQPG